MTHDNQRYIIVWCDGCKYVVEERDLDKLYDLDKWESNGFVELHAIEDGTPMFLRAKDISSFLLSTPKARSNWDEWHKQFDDDEKPDWLK